MDIHWKYTVFPSDMGWMAVLTSPKGLVRITLPQASRQEALKLLDAGEAEWSPEEFSDLTARLQDYCGGRNVPLPDALDLCQGTPFQCEVWRTTRLIPYGETQSYNWVAEQMGRPGAARAAGQALARNPLPIIVPCHRVVASNGALTGFAGGLEMKQRLLSLEASEDSSYCNWQMPNPYPKLSFWKESFTSVKDD